LKNGYIVQVAPVSKFDSLDTFKQTIRDLPLDYSLSPVPTVTFTGLDGNRLTATYGEAPSIDGKTVNYADWKLFDGPFTRAERESQSVEILHGGESLFLDFKNITSTSTLSKEK
jgi:hypothetical protein